MVLLLCFIAIVLFLIFLLVIVHSLVFGIDYLNFDNDRYDIKRNHSRYILDSF